MAKRSRRNLGQSLRGSSDLHAWTDSACYLVRRADDRLLLRNKQVRMSVQGTEWLSVASCGPPV